MKHLKLIGVLSTLIVAAVAILNLGQTFASTANTNTTLGIRTGVLSFYKDTTTAMDSYFSHSGNQSASIDIGTYDASLAPISAQSSGDHRFTVSDMAGKSFTVTLASSDLTATGGLSISSGLVTYTGTTRYGTGKALTATGTFNTALSSPVTFVARSNASGISKFAQEITLKVAVPAAQGPESYTGLLTFTY